MDAAVLFDKIKETDSRLIAAAARCQDHGLFRGRAGICYGLACRYCITGDEYLLDIMEPLLPQIVSEAAKSPNITFQDGLAGVAYLFHKLSVFGIADTTDILRIFDDTLYRLLNSTTNFDGVEEAIGNFSTDDLVYFLYYILERHSSLIPGRGRQAEDRMVFERLSIVLSEKIFAGFSESSTDYMAEETFPLFLSLADTMCNRGINPFRALKITEFFARAVFRENPTPGQELRFLRIIAAFCPITGTGYFPGLRKRMMSRAEGTDLYEMAREAVAVQNISYRDGLCGIMNLGIYAEENGLLERGTVARAGSGIIDFAGNYLSDMEKTSDTASLSEGYSGFALLLSRLNPMMI